MGFYFSFQNSFLSLIICIYLNLAKSIYCGQFKVFVLIAESHEKKDRG